MQMYESLQLKTMAGQTKMMPILLYRGIYLMLLSGKAPPSLPHPTSNSRHLF